MPESLVERLGMEYQSIPVPWDAPKQTDVEQFFATMQANDGRRVFVHCAANMRVSAFMYLYRTLVQTVDPGVATLNLQQIWTPNEIWQQLMSAVIAAYRSQ
jgi:protein tyrosine phosphatase (PTP) superfamily phosphohydrolase (DUF442 family)